MNLRSFGVTLPNVDMLTSIIPDAFVIAIISFVINISQAKLLAKKNSYTVHPDQVSCGIARTRLCVATYV